MSVISKIINKKAKVAIIGLGYVGLPLAVEFSKTGFFVFGIDNNQDRVMNINKGISYIPDISSEEIRKAIDDGNFIATADYEVLKSSDAIIICVPTPLKKSKDPDLSYIVQAAAEITKYLHRGHLVVLQSTTYPGTTEEVVLPILQKKGLQIGRDFFLSFSPERVDPGNKKYTLKNTPKVIGGTTSKCSEITKALYEQIVSEVMVVSSPKIAEMSKLLENIFRGVNIALVNEMALLCNKMGISVWEVVSAAATKPFGFMSFHPGPGLGGHCIPVDPFYLSWKAREYGFHTKFIELSGEINESMPSYVVDRIIEGLNLYQKSVKGSEVLILGVSYKKDIDDTRESPAFSIIELLLNKGAKVTFSDPFVSEIELAGLRFFSSPITNGMLKQTDCVVIVTDHSTYDHNQIVENAKLIIDTRNALGNYTNPNIIRL